jgi:hypothetical protein
LLLCHWGSVDAPDFPPFNADPDSLPDRVEIWTRASHSCCGDCNADQTPENYHPLSPGDSLMADDGMRRIRLFQVRRMD